MLITTNGGPNSIKNFQIFIKSLTKTITIEVSLHDDVLTVMRLIEKKEGIIVVKKIYDFHYDFFKFLNKVNKQYGYNSIILIFSYISKNVKTIIILITLIFSYKF